MTVSPHLRLGNDSLSHQAKRGVTPIAKPVRREKAPSRLSRSSELKRGPSKLKQTPLGHCTDEQKARVADLACIHCGVHAGYCHPAHVIDSGGLDVEIANDVRAVVPLCASCHRAYDDGKLDLSRDLEPIWRDAWEWAVGAVGFFRALHRITGKRWLPVGEGEAA